MIADERDSTVLADQVKSLDWKVRNAQFRSKIAPGELAQVRAKAVALMGKP